MDSYYLEQAIVEAKKAYKKNDVPVGAIIVKNNKIIAKAYNKKEKTKVATHHAEILAIEKACKKMKSWRLNDCIMYVSLEPCLMCKGAIIESRIKRVVYCLKNQKTKFVSEKKIENTEFTYKKVSNESEKMLKSFFENKR